MSRPFPKINLQPCNVQQLRFTDNQFSHCNNRYLLSCSACNRAATRRGSRSIGFRTTTRCGFSCAARFRTIWWASLRTTVWFGLSTARLGGIERTGLCIRTALSLSSTFSFSIFSKEDLRCCTRCTFCCLTGFGLRAGR